MRVLTRQNRRSPAVFLGLALAGFAAACTAEASGPGPTVSAATPIACSVAVDAIPGGSRIAGQVTSTRTLNGSYALAVTSRSAGGSASIRQSGEFTARAGETTSFGSTELTGSPAQQNVDLEIRVEGQRLACARPL